MFFLLFVVGIAAADTIKYAVGDPLPPLPMHNCTNLPISDEVATIRYCQRKITSSFPPVYFRAGYRPGPFDPNEKDRLKQNGEDALDLIEGGPVVSKLNRSLVADGDSYVIRLSNQLNFRKTTPDFIFWATYEMPSLTFVFDLPNTSTAVVYYPQSLVNQRRLVVSQFDVGTSGT
jgi:hypothetical protein